MLEDIYHFYKTELTFYNLVYRKVNLWFRILTLFVLLCGFTCMGSYVTHREIYLVIIGFAITAIAFTLNHFFIALTIKRFYPQYYISRFSWNVAGFHKDAIAKLGRYLRREDIDENKAKILQGLLREKGEKERTNSIVFLSCFAALFIPLWNTYLDHLFDAVKDVDAQGQIFAVILMGIFFISFLMMNLGDFRDNIFTRFMKLNRLSELISEVYLRANSSEDQTILIIERN